MHPFKRIISIALTVLLLLTALALNPVVGRAEDPTATSVPVDIPTEVPTDTPVPTSTVTPQPPTDIPTDVPATDTATAAPTDTPAPTDTVGLTGTAVPLTDTATTVPQPTRTAKPKATATATATTNPLQSLSVGADADSSLGYSSTTADTNYGSDTSIAVDGNPEQAGLIRFTINGGIGALVSAKLRLYVRDATDVGPLIYLASSDWNENTVTGSTQPIRSERALSFPGPVPSGNAFEFDVTGLVGGNGTFTFELVAQSGDRLQFSSRESGASSQRPKLIVEFDPRVPSATPTETSTPTVPPTATFTPVPTESETAAPSSTSTTAPLDTATAIAPTETGTATPSTKTKSGQSPDQSLLAGATPQTISFGAEADTYVSETSPNSNFGSLTSFAADDNPHQEGLVRFTVSGVTGGVVNATLRLYVRDSTNVGPLVYLAGNTWDETAVTWANRPSIAGSPVQPPASYPLGTTVDFDVTALVANNGTYTFDLVAQSPDVVQFTSRNSAATSQRPKLIVTFDSGAPTATPANTDTATAGPTVTPSTAGTMTATATPTAQPGQAITFSAEADTYISETSPGTNYGSLTSFAVDDNPHQEGLIRFTVSGGTGGVVSAKLRLYVRDSTNLGPLVYLAGNNWTETTVTWANRPLPTGSPVQPPSSFTVGSFAEFDVTALVTANGTYTFNLVAQSPDVVQFTSRDSGATSQRPQLVVSFGSGGPTATPVVSATSTTTATPSPTPDATNTASATATAAVVSISMTPVADAYIDATAADTNFGSLTTLRTDAKPEQESLLRFNVTGVTGRVTKAVLTLWVIDGTGTTTGPNIFLADNNWSQGTVTWNTRPSRFGSGLDFPEPLPSQSWHDFDVTDLVGGNGTFTFDLLATSTNEAVFSSKESSTASLRPVLRITIDPAGPTATATVTMTPTATATATATGTPSGIIGDRDFSYVGSSAPTAKEGQSKVWFVGGQWWGALWSAGSFRICKLDLSSSVHWSGCLAVVDTRSSAKIDALWDPSTGKLYTVSTTTGAAAIQIRQFTLQGGAWSIDPGFPVSLPNNVGAEEGVVTIAKDTTGTLWVTYVPSIGDAQVYITHTDGSAADWVTPYVLPTTGATVVPGEDLSVVVAFNGQIGIMWSNQFDEKMYFARHVDGTGDQTWIKEIAAGGSQGVDNHISLKSDSSGRVYAALKTSGSSSSSTLPLEYLAVRGTDGVWRTSTFSTVADNQTRGVVVVNEAKGLLYFFASDYSTSAGSGGRVYYKTAVLGNHPIFGGGIGKGTPIISSNLDVNVNNVSATKQIISGGMGILIIAGDDTTHRYLHNRLP